MAGQRSVDVMRVRITDADRAALEPMTMPGARYRGAPMTLANARMACAGFILSC
jgi:hypothetical protein